MSADLKGSPVARRMLQRCPSVGAGSLYPNMAILGCSCLGGWCDFAWSSSFRLGTIPGEELGEESAQNTEWWGTELGTTVEWVVSSERSLFFCSQQWNMEKERDKDRWGQLDDFC